VINIKSEFYLIFREDTLVLLQANGGEGGKGGMGGPGGRGGVGIILLIDN
jgi:hypothetical protein